MQAFFVVLAALALDAFLGEPRRAHPLVAFGRLAEALERRCNRGRARRLKGVAAVVLLVAPPTLAGALLAAWLGPVAEVAILYLALGLHALHRHIRPVGAALAQGDLEAARACVARVVSRDAAALDAPGVARAATESALENGADAVFASLFWYLAAGAPGVVAHRLVNTLDAMWGYRSERFARFGWAAARLDDLLNWVPARLTALAYALAGDTRRALRCWQAQGGRWESPNAGPVMAAGAGALGLRLGGPAPYPGGLRRRPVLGEGRAVHPGAPEAALALVRRALALWLLVLGVGGMALG